MKAWIPLVLATLASCRKPRASFGAFEDVRRDVLARMCSPGTSRSSTRRTGSCGAR